MPLRSCGNIIAPIFANSSIVFSKLMRRCPSMRAENLRGNLINPKLVAEERPLPSKSDATHQVEIISRTQCVFFNLEIMFQPPE
jgi:hypothetical protein